MSIQHGGPVTLKPINEIAEYLRNLIPANMPGDYALKSRFDDIASEEDIRNGVIAFRDFLYLFCDRLISDGDLYAKPKKKPQNETDYPFLYQITDLLSDIGYYSSLSENGDSLLITKLPSFVAWIDENGDKKKSRNPASRLMECMRFLALCGFVFSDIDLGAKSIDLTREPLFEVLYPHAPLLLTGLKAMAIADIELRVKRYVSDYNHDNLLRCDYRLIKAEESDITDVLKDFLYPLPAEVQKFALELNQHAIDIGMTCVTLISPFDIHFAYSSVKNSRRTLSVRDIYQQRIWEFALSPKYGYSLAVRSKKTDKYTDVIANFSPLLQEKIARGYGCDRKLRNEPCQGGCQGIRISLDHSILNISNDIKTWFDLEI